jgi:hypothetical protein
LKAGLGKLIAERVAQLPFAAAPEDIVERGFAAHEPSPGPVSRNGTCRLIEARDGWVAINLARSEDVELVRAVSGISGDLWQGLTDMVASLDCAAFVEWGTELHLPVARLAEASVGDLPGDAPALARAVRVIDLTALWAGPLCAGLLSRAGAKVTRVENVARPDPTARSWPELDKRLNGTKDRIGFDLSSRHDRDRLLAEIRSADVLVTSARRDALARLGIDDAVFRSNPGLLWVAVTGHGWEVDRVGFGDDCAVAGGLVEWRDNIPAFAGDALADPLTGLEAALTALSMLRRGKAGLVDMAMAMVSAAYGEKAVSCR